MRVINALAIAFSTYSRIPMPQVEWSEDNKRLSMCFFPLIGVVIGLCLWLCRLICTWLKFDESVFGAAGALVPLLVTGGIHMDGFMDTADALASWQPKEKKLEILKDSRVGAFAVMSCIGYLMLMAVMLREAGDADIFAIGACFTASRAMSAYLATALKGARQDGMLSGFARAAQKRAVGVSGAIWLAAALVVWALRGWPVLLICALSALMCALYYRHMAYKQFGGVTGDLAGWFSQTAELVLITAVIVGGRLL